MYYISYNELAINDLFGRGRAKGEPFGKVPLSLGPTSFEALVR
jgi:hypothetical protein